MLFSIVLASEVFVYNKSLDAKLVTLRQEHSSNDGERRFPEGRETLSHAFVGQQEAL